MSVPEHCTDIQESRPRRRTALGFQEMRSPGLRAGRSAAGPAAAMSGFNARLEIPNDSVLVVACCGRASRVPSLESAHAEGCTAIAPVLSWTTKNLRSSSTSVTIPVSEKGRPGSSPVVSTPAAPQHWLAPSCRRGLDTRRAIHTAPSGRARLVSFPACNYGRADGSQLFMDCPASCQSGPRFSMFPLVYF